MNWWLDVKNPGRLISDFAEGYIVSVDGMDKHFYIGQKNGPTPKVLMMTNAGIDEDPKQGGDWYDTLLSMGACVRNPYDKNIGVPKYVVDIEKLKTRIPTMNEGWLLESEIQRMQEMAISGDNESVVLLEKIIHTKAALLPKHKGVVYQDITKSYTVMATESKDEGLFQGVVMECNAPLEPFGLLLKGTIDYWTCEKFSNKDML